MIYKNIKKHPILEWQFVTVPVLHVMLCVHMQQVTLSVGVFVAILIACSAVMLAIGSAVGVLVTVKWLCNGSNCCHKGMDSDNNADIIDLSSNAAYGSVKKDSSGAILSIESH